MVAPDFPVEVDVEPEPVAVPVDEDPEPDPDVLEPDPDVLLALLALGEPELKVPLLPEDPEEPVDPAAAPVPTIEGTTTSVVLAPAPAGTVAAAS